MLNRMKSAISRGALVATLASLALGLGVVGSEGVAEAQRRGRATMTQAAPSDAPGSVVVNLNTATEAELGHLPGIGPSKAAAIVAYRARGRRFRRVEELMRVRGIGRATFRRLRPMLRVEGPTRVAPSAPAQE